MIATGSEVDLAVKAQKVLAEQGKDVSVVSMPSFDLFEQQSAEYQESVLPKAVTKRVSIEMVASFGWERYTGQQGQSLRSIVSARAHLGKRSSKIISLQWNMLLKCLINCRRYFCSFYYLKFQVKDTSTLFR